MYHDYETCPMCDHQFAMYSAHTCEVEPVTNPDPNPILKHFAYSHLPTNLQVVSKEFHRIAVLMHHELPDGPEKVVALRKLLEGKDAAVRAALEPKP